MIMVRNWQRDILSNILKKYKEDDIYNVDEFGLFWKILPDKTFAFKSIFFFLV